MEKLTTQEYKAITSIIKKEQDSIRKESYTDRSVAEKYHQLTFIIIKLNAQMEINKENN